MRARLHAVPHAERPAGDARARGAVVGLAGGLVGTVAMDLFGGALFAAMGGPASLSFTIIGDSAAAFFALFGVALAGGAPLGALLHYLIGLALGGLFGVAAASVAALRLRSWAKAVGLGVLYVEVASQPLLVAAALVLHMTGAETAQWFGVSFVMHLVYGTVLGLVTRSRLRTVPAAGRA